MLDNVIDLNFYPLRKVKATNLKSRSIGLGVMGEAEMLASSKITWGSKEHFKKIDEVMETISYNAILSSSNLAVEKSVYPTFDGSNWSKGIMPHDFAPQSVNALVEKDLFDSSCDWESLREKVKKDDSYLALLKSGINSDILLSRPDIKELEYKLRAKNANIGAARAAFFPSISLTANTGFASSSLNNLFSNPNSFWQLSPSINIPIFNAGENSAKLDLSKTQKEIALNEYQKGIQTAFKEINDALIVRKNIYTKLENQKELTTTVEDAYKIALNSYKIGYGSYLNMLIAQKAYINSQKALVQTYLEELENRVEIFKTLGGNID